MIKKPAACSLVAGIALTLTLALSPSATAADAADAVSTSVSSSTSAPSTQSTIDALLSESGYSADLEAKIRAAAARLPSDWESRLATQSKRFGLADTTWYAQSQSAINAGDYQCGRTPVQDWLSAQMNGVNGFRMLLLSVMGGDQIPTYDALVFGQESKANYFGADGSYTTELNREMTGLKRFWDFDGSDVQLIPMHGDAYRDLDRITRVYVEVFGLDAQAARANAEVVQAIVLNEPALRGGDSPYFTFNAFAFSPEPADIEQYGLTKRIIVGDGVLEGMRGIGLQDKAAPLGVLAHEYGHQVQYAKNLFESPLTGPEATRRTELMADAFGTYYLVHARGSALNSQRTLDVEGSFYNVGDCNFGMDSHHGTPNQRLKSAQFAVSIVDGAQDQGHKLPALEFDAAFETALPEIVAPDNE
ncbi:hypothetical protein [Streptomyces sp. NPDC056165]|uniref:hypothetical protein n=1 Tax=Streptomyces sp. NPDC056165 TaxID=3345733 RepID=UPI0035E2D284